MTREKVVELLCAIMGLAFHSIGNYKQACDCVCPTHSTFQFSNYANNGDMLVFLADAVTEKLTRDGHTVSRGDYDHVQKLITERFNR